MNSICYKMNKARKLFSRLINVMASTPSPGESENLPSSPSSASGAQSAKAKRYDRQLRLWGDHGQAAIERAQVCVINATATATEILKNIVLPGVGKFTILDEQKVREEDAGNNFFLGKEHIGQFRGLAAKDMLLELNPEVRGNSIESSVQQILQDQPNFFKSFSLVIATDLDEETLKVLSSHLWMYNIPLMIVRSYGLLGYIRLQLKEHTVVESHPENEIHDLRLDTPFQNLKDYMDSVNLSEMTKNAHMHTPYVIILYKKLAEWKQQYGSDRPKNWKEKQTFKELIRSGILRNEEGIPEDEENFEEAIRATNTALQPTKIPDNIKTIFNDSKCLNLSSESEDFWVICRAVKDFVDNEGNGNLPVRGSIPDMFSDSKSYIHLQGIYKEKATHDFEEVYKKVQYHLESIGRNSESINESSVKKFCKEASNLRMIRGTSIKDEYAGIQEKSISPLNGEAAEMANASSFDWTNALDEQNDNSDAATYYMILRGVDRFRSEYRNYPGVLDVESDIGRLKKSIEKVLNDYSIPSNAIAIKDDCIHEVCRYGGAELHAMAAFMGGCASQEAIKVLTKQYVPVDNLFIFNTMTSKTTQLKI